MIHSSEHFGGLLTVRVTTGDVRRLVVVMLHGYSMEPADLAPFAQSLGVSAEFYVPAAPLAAEGPGRAWWPIDQERRTHALAKGPRDLFEEHPAGLPDARTGLRHLVSAVHARTPQLPLVLLGFSQGGMLACDAVLHDHVRPAALVLLSTSRLAATEWGTRADRLRDLPVLISHGEQDPDLAFTAGEALRDFCVAAGARVTWVPFAGGHEIPLLVWRHVRRFLNAL